ncbi:hypothetical protein F3Y22_tig00112289pilonHSYRG00180 [Hibiscus syriacus]|uniref:Haem-binding uptake Tiki superfamily ChaN domain-containing protein n=1 Tax=Hibiscus syriacus TaxID=106335 RepID=A0A6A2XNZ7_HIBSY|nr:hypothetical protein F3Y22_tig00112289pilonHSYRG00180 [Hibiscus syriacus]
MYYRWHEYDPILNYCRDNEVRLVACGTPLKIQRTVQAEGIRGLSKAERKAYAPPAGSGFITGFSSISRRSSMYNHFPTQSIPFGPSSYLSAQPRVVEEYNMSQIILKEVSDGGGTARPCSRNCFDRAEIARVMNAAGRQRDALPQDK